MTLVLFFMQFRRFFLDTRRTQVLSLLGALFGLGAGVCFAGVAFHPGGCLHGGACGLRHVGLPPVPAGGAVLHPGHVRDAGLPRGYAYVFFAFFGLLIAYYLLLSQGPGFETDQGLVIQALAQKVIVYASILSIFIQSLGRGVCSAARLVCNSSEAISAEFAQKSRSGHVRSRACAIICLPPKKLQAAARASACYSRSTQISSCRYTRRFPMKKIVSILLVFAIFLLSFPGGAKAETTEDPYERCTCRPTQAGCEQRGGWCAGVE